MPSPPGKSRYILRHITTYYYILLQFTRSQLNTPRIVPAMSTPLILLNGEPIPFSDLLELHGRNRPTSCAESDSSYSGSSSSDPSSDSSSLDSRATTTPTPPSQPGRRKPYHICRYKFAVRSREVKYLYRRERKRLWRGGREIGKAVAGCLRQVLRSFGGRSYRRGEY